jgi:hypothetical protein
VTLRPITRVRSDAVAARCAVDRAARRVLPTAHAVADRYAAASSIGPVARKIAAGIVARARVSVVARQPSTCVRHSGSRFGRSGSSLGQPGLGWTGFVLRLHERQPLVVEQCVAARE